MGSARNRWLGALWFLVGTLKTKKMVKKVYMGLAYVLMAMLAVWYVASYIIPCTHPILDECPPPQNFLEFWAGLFT